MPDPSRPPGSLTAQRAGTSGRLPDIPGVTALVRIDDGGFCEVFRGRQGATGRGVAVKILPAPFDRPGRLLFDREWSRLRRLSELVTVLQVDQIGELPDGRPYLISELCAESCAQRVALDGALSQEGVAALGAEIGDALAAVHELGVVHGSVSPRNVLFRRSGQAVLGDVGIAARSAYQGDVDYVGEYVAPETLRTGGLDEASDVYGLGTMMYLAITGQPPFPTRIGEHNSERILRVLGQAPPTVTDELAGSELASIINELLSPDPARRPSAREAADRCAALVPGALPAPGPELPVLAEPEGRAAADERRTDRIDEELVRLDSSTRTDPGLSTDWSDLLDDVLCDTDASDSPRQQRGLTRPAWTEPALPRELSDDDVDPEDDEEWHRKTARPHRSRSRSIAALGGAIAAGAALLVVVNIGGGKDPRDNAQGAAPAAQSEAPVSSPDRTSVAPRVPVSDVRLLTVTDRSRSVLLRWSGDADMEYAVVVRRPGQPAAVTLVSHRKSAAIALTPGLPYCLRVQGTNGARLVETPERGIRGASCK